MTGQRQSGGKAALPPKRRQYRETPDVAAATRRLIRSTGKRLAWEDPDELRYLREVEEEVRRAWQVAVGGMRSAGWTDSQIGAALGTTRQAVEQRWPRREAAWLASSSTGEHRKAT